MTSITAKVAQEYISKARVNAQQLGINVCIAIVDSGSHLVAFEKMDGAFLGSIDIAIKKAKTSALFPLESGTLGELIRAEQLTGFELSNDALMGFPGGLPVFIEHTQVGAIGISGGSAEQDVMVANAALG